MTKGSKTLFITILALGLMALATTSMAVTRTVAQGGGADYTTINDALTTATDGDIIEIQDSATYTENVTISVPNLQLTAASGQTPTVSSAAFSPTLNGGFGITSGGLVLNATGIQVSGLTIQTHGGGLVSMTVEGGASATVTNCTVAAGAYSAAAAGSLTLDNTTVQGSAGTLVTVFAIAPVVIQNNSVIGAALANGTSVNTTADLTVTNSTINSGGAGCYGIIQGGGVLSLTGSAIAGAGGVGIQVGAVSQVTMTGTTFTNNSDNFYIAETATGLTVDMTNVTITGGNYAVRTHGSSVANITMTDCSIQTPAVAGFSDGVGASGSREMTNLNLNFAGSNWALYMSTGPSTITLNSSSVINGNIGVSFGGPGYLDANGVDINAANFAALDMAHTGHVKVDMDGGNITNNDVTAGNGGGWAVRKVGGPGSVDLNMGGGTISASDPQFSCVWVQSPDNTMDIDLAGGSIINTGSVACINNVAGGTLNITANGGVITQTVGASTALENYGNATITGPVALSGGVWTILNNGAGNVFLNDLSINGNGAGSAYYQQIGTSGNVELYNCDITTANGGSCVEIANVGNAGWAHTGNLTVTSCTLRDSTGNGIYGYSSGKWTVTSCTISGNNNDGINASNNAGNRVSPEIEVTGTTFSGNGGSAIFISGTDVVASVDQITVSSSGDDGIMLQAFNTLDLDVTNSSISNTGRQGIWVWDGDGFFDILVKDTVIDSCDRGILMDKKGQYVLDNVTISNSVVEGFRFYAPTIDAPSTLTATDCTFSNNTGMATMGDSDLLNATFTNCTFDNNTRMNAFCDATFTDCDFLSTSDGDRTLNLEGSGHTVLENCSFANRTAYDVFLWGTHSAEVTSCTFGAGAAGVNVLVGTGYPTATFDDCAFSLDGQGAFQVRDGVTTVTNSTFTKAPTAVNAWEARVVNFESAAYGSSATMTMDNCDIDAGFIGYIQYPAADLALKDSTVKTSGNAVFVQAGLFGTTSTSLSLDMDNVDFIAVNADYGFIQETTGTYSTVNVDADACTFKNYGDSFFMLAHDGAVNLDQCTFVPGAWNLGTIVTTTTFSGSVDVVDSIFYSGGITNASTESPTITEDYNAFINGATVTGVTSGTHSLEAADAYFVSTTWGDADYLKVYDDSIAYGLNSTGPEDYAGAKGWVERPLPPASAKEWALY